MVGPGTFARVDPTADDQERMGPLALARQRFDLLKLLLDHGVDPSVTFRGVSPLQAVLRHLRKSREQEQEIADDELLRNRDGETEDRDADLRMQRATSSLLLDMAELLSSAQQT